MVAKKKDVKIRNIRDGVVIDHIRGGKALEVLRILGVDEDFPDTVSLVMNVDSKVLGKKDIVKVENRELEPGEVNQIAIVAPDATINTVRNYKVVDKNKVKLPDQVTGILECSNPQCVTNKEREPVETVFQVKSRRPLILICKYCERELG